MRHSFEYTGGMYPELITRADMKVFLPPIGYALHKYQKQTIVLTNNIRGLTVYIFGDPAKLSDENVRLACRVHDECNGSGKHRS